MPSPATPGIHFPESAHYIRRVRLAGSDPLLPALRAAGYAVEDAAEGGGAVVVEVPVHAGAGVRTAREVGMWEQLSLAALMQRVWADNQVSVTVTFDPATEGPQLQRALDFFQYQLKVRPARTPRHMILPLTRALIALGVVTLGASPPPHRA